MRFHEQLRWGHYDGGTTAHPSGSQIWEGFAQQIFRTRLGHETGPDSSSERVNPAKEVPRGTPGYPGVLRGTPVYSEAPRCTPRHPGVPRGTPGYPEAPRGTPGYPEAPRGTKEAPRGTPRHPETPVHIEVSLGPSANPKHHRCKRTPNSLPERFKMPSIGHLL
jgi:hypothetical protein